MKVLLISHPDKYRQKPDFPPIGVAYLGAVSVGGGHETLLIDGGLTGIPGILRQAKAFSPDFIGVTCWTIHRGTVWKLCAMLTEALPNAILALGGPHATLFPDHVLAKTHASVVVLGEGEETFGELLEALDKGRDLEQVRGIAYRSRDGAILRTGPRPQIENLDAIFYPYYTGYRDFTFRHYAGFPALPRPTAAMITSRGCVFDCTYCASVSFWGRRWRYRSAANILGEMDWLVKELGVKSLYLFDDNFPVNKERAAEICEGMLTRKYGIRWSCCSHVRMADRDLLKLMKSSGCVSIDFGVESGSDRILKSINKKQTRKDIERAFSLAHEAGIKPRAFIMVGNSGEDEGTIDETIDLIGRIRPYSSVGASILWLLPGTTVYDEAVKNGHIRESYWRDFDDVPFNTQEREYKELIRLRQRLMLGIARKKEGLMPLVNYYLKTVYYRYPFLSPLRALVPDVFR